MNESMVETLDDGGSRRSGFRIRPRLDFIYIVEYGQPDRSPGGLFVPDSDEDFWRYRQMHWRFGEVIAVGPGRWHKRLQRRMPMPDIAVGDKVVFSRKFGTRLPKCVYDIESMHYPDAGRLNIRVLDPTKIAGVVNSFEPWWDIANAQLDPGGVMTG